MKKQRFIAEVKTQSPFGFRSSKSWDELFELANASCANCISIHTDPRWGGSLELVSKAAKASTKPILAKGIHPKDSDLQDALSAGADIVLCVGRIPGQSYFTQSMIEVRDLTQLVEEEVLMESLFPVVWNARCLSTGVKLNDSWSTARRAFSGDLCQASFIRTKDDVKKDAEAFIVGEHLPEFLESLKSVDTLPKRPNMGRGHRDLECDNWQP